MKRSILTDKFNRKNWEDYERKVKRQYKEENKKPLNCSVIEYVTIGVINRKGTPDVEDLTELMKISIYKDGQSLDEEIDNRLKTWLEIDGNREKGYMGAFYEVCNDLLYDIPTHPVIAGKIKNMWDISMARINTEDKIKGLFKQLAKLSDNTDKASDETKEIKETKDNNIVDFKEVNKEESDEMGVENKDTQE